MKKYFIVKIALIMAIIMLVPTVWAQGNVFVDVPYDHWARESIENIYERGVIRGRGNGIFDPETNVTRQELMWMLENFFTEGIEFTEDERVGLNQFISRIDTFTILARAFSLEGSLSDLLNYADLAGLTLIQLNSLAAMQRAAGLTGFIDDFTGVRTAQPHGFLTRAQAARILDNIITYDEAREIEEEEEEEEEEIIEEEIIITDIELASVRINSSALQEGDVALAYVTPSTATVTFEWRVQTASGDENNSRVISTAPFVLLEDVEASDKLILTVTGYGRYVGQVNSMATIISGNPNNLHYIQINITNPRVGDELFAEVVYGGISGVITWVSCRGVILGTGYTYSVTVNDIGSSITAQLNYGTIFATSSQWTEPTREQGNVDGRIVGGMRMVHVQTNTVVLNSEIMDTEYVPYHIMNLVNDGRYLEAYLLMSGGVMTQPARVHVSEGDVLRLEINPNLDLGVRWIDTNMPMQTTVGIDGLMFEVEQEHIGRIILLITTNSDNQYLGLVPVHLVW